MAGQPYSVEHWKGMRGGMQQHVLFLPRCMHRSDLTTTVVPLVICREKEAALACVGIVADSRSCDSPSHSESRQCPVGMRDEPAHDVLETAVP